MAAIRAEGQQLQAAVVWGFQRGEHGRWSPNISAQPPQLNRVAGGGQCDDGAILGERDRRTLSGLSRNSEYRVLPLTHLIKLKQARTAGDQPLAVRTEDEI